MLLIKEIAFIEVLQFMERETRVNNKYTLKFLLKYQNESWKIITKALLKSVCW